MCPPIGAGIIALQCRAEDTGLLALADRLNDTETNRQADAERAMLHALQGNCNSPIAGYATTDPTGRLSLHGKVFSLDGTQWLDSHHWGSRYEDPQALGFFVGSDLLRRRAPARSSTPSPTDRFLPGKCPSAGANVVQLHDQMSGVAGE